MSEGWLAAMCECRVCSKRHVSVYPTDIREEENQECPRCKAPACEPVFYIHPDGSYHNVEEGE